MAGLAGCSEQSSDGASTPVRNSRDLSFLQVPPGFVIEPYANTDELGGGEFRPGPEPGPRLMDSRDDVLYVTIPSQDRVVALPPTPDGGHADRVVDVAEDLDRPHGIAFHGEHLYLATEREILRYRTDGLGVDEGTRETIVSDIPSGGFHWTRTIAIHDDRLYLSAGACLSNSDHCSTIDDTYLAAITRFELDGSDPTTFARGLRNAVGMAWHGGQLLATDNGVDDLGPEEPPDELNVVREGGHYGFPECYGDNVPIEDGAGEPCGDRVPPVATFPAHSAPLGLDVYDAGGFPRGYRGQVFVALHGSWARPDPVGYKVLRVTYDGGSFGEPADFVTGWMPEGDDNDDARGRPVDVHVARDGSMFVTDDMDGTVYRIAYEGD